MKQIAAKVAAKFVKEYTVTVKVPKSIEGEFSAEEVELYLDRVVRKVKAEDGSFVEEIVEEGTPIASGEPFKALSADHSVTAVCGNEEFKVIPVVTKIGPKKTKASITANKRPQPKPAAATTAAE